ncbi:MAG: glycosyltransferase family 2 protein [Lachnospiraceae bacterium]|nr:glycosyltransferase family 2 protein [Lachnospiraceae bacterium]
MKKVQVLLSSYNGEKYIREQIDSILAQENVEVELLIRDDGSTDGTVEILRKYEAEYDNIRVFFGENQGVIKSFFRLIEEAGEKADYTAFSDQDDVWLPGKLERAVTMLERENLSEKILGQDNRKSPLVYCSAKQLVDEQLRLLPAAIRYKIVRPFFGNALVENMCTGCTCVINRDMLCLLKGRKPEFTVMHDFWVYLVGSCFGQVVYDEESYILYRQHGGNELGAASSLAENYKRRVKNFKKHRGQLTRQAEELLRLYGTGIPEEKRVLAEKLVQAKRKRKMRWNVIRSGRVFRQRKSDDVIMKMLLLAGLL